MEDNFQQSAPMKRNAMQMNLGQVVNAPIEKVFEVFTDFVNVAERVEGIQRVEILTDGPAGPGTRFKETRVIFGCKSTEEMEVTEFISNEFYVVEANTCGSHFKSTFRFNSQGTKTAVEVEIETSAVTMFAKLLQPLGRIMSGSMKKCMMSDIDQLKEYCERSVD